MITLANAELDRRILRVLDQGGFGTSYFIAGTLAEKRERISDRLKSLKARGIVQCRGAVWRRARAEASA